MIDGSNERVNLVTIDSWFAKINDKLRFKCFKELATVKFTPSLNFKTSEDVAKDTEKLKSKKHTDIGTYYLNVAEELNDFSEWCISERACWGVPIPFFVRKDTEEIVCDGEIARYVGDVFRKHGGSDAWYKLSVEELLPPRYKKDATFLTKGKQVFDVWFDNALSWDYVLLKDAHSMNEVSQNIRSRLPQVTASADAGQ